MAFSLQSIQKRLSSLLAYAISASFVIRFGERGGVRAGIGLSIVLVGLSWLVQFRFMRTAVVDQVLTLHNPWSLLGRFDPQLRRLLVSDILARWCEGLSREFLILYCVSKLVVSQGWSLPQASAFYVSTLLGAMNLTSLVLYLPIGHLASMEGAAKKPFIGMTFVFFALFPVALGPRPRVRDRGPSRDRRARAQGDGDGAGPAGVSYPGHRRLLVDAERGGDVCPARRGLALAGRSRPFALDCRRCGPRGGALVFRQVRRRRAGGPFRRPAVNGLFQSAKAQHDAGAGPIRSVPPRRSKLDAAISRRRQ
jgi:hypothetical protein